MAGEACNQVYLPEEAVPNRCHCHPSRHLFKVALGTTGRYFAGLYLAFRLFLFFAYLQHKPLHAIFSALATIVLYILLIAAFKPYKNVFLNYVDMCIFADMAFVSCVSWYVEESDDIYIFRIVIVIAMIFVCLPMLYIITYLMWHLTSRHHERIKRKCSIWCNRISSRSHTVHQSSTVPLVPHAVTQSSDKFIQLLDDNIQYNRPLKH